MKRRQLEADVANTWYIRNQTINCDFAGADQLLQTVRLHEIDAWMVVRGTIGFSRPMMMRPRWMGRIVAIMGRRMLLLIRAYA